MQLNFIGVVIFATFKRTIDIAAAATTTKTAKAATIETVATEIAPTKTT